MARLTPGRLFAATAIAALTLFAVVQDRIVAAGVGRYMTLKRAELAGSGRPVTVADVMEPAVRESMWRGLVWGGGVFVAGCGLAIIRSRGGTSR